MPSLHLIIHSELENMWKHSSYCWCNWTTEPFSLANNMNYKWVTMDDILKLQKRKL